MVENQRIRITKKMLKDSLVRLLNEESIHQISVRDICENAQINRTTFYKYYGSQYDLLEDMENDVVSQVDNYINADEIIDDNRPWLMKIINFIDDNIDLCRILLNNNVDPAFPEKLISLPTIRQVISQQLPERYGEDELAYFVDFAINGGFSIIKRWINKERRETPEEIAALLNISIIRMFPA